MKVSVCMITYGHEKFIRQAIEGVLMQECNFDYELVIANDCSPDATDEIVKDILQTHPNANKVRYFSHTENLGMMPNFLFAMAQCKGEYVAMCEGDDYWITKDKLQKQVDILEANPTIGLVYTDVKHYDQQTERFIKKPAGLEVSKADVIRVMLKNKFIEFPTTMFRKKVLDKAVEINQTALLKGVIGDTRILLETAYLSDIFFLKEVTTVYRIVAGSASHPKNIDKYIFALKDSYLCRKEFVERHNLPKVWLSDAVCNTNRGLINRAFIADNYTNALKLLKNVVIFEMFSYSSKSVIKQKMTLGIWGKGLLALLGIGVLRQKIK
ncbi:glycosyltransferase [Flavobacterium supellecticarium]|uniref:Glycosyltransferase n=1 Tax=Flavobacterium supellecticarium TaxID=2565924 RepID=A0A4S3ZXL1_9FLAO|nr:glycosyltransferase [Flavobacterium supellecticarium]THF50571.1 glycosyltransferase [Flavobacterium supellecticarium]